MKEPLQCPLYFSLTNVTSRHAVYSVIQLNRVVVASNQLLTINHYFNVLVISRLQKFRWHVTSQTDDKYLTR